MQLQGTAKALMLGLFDWYALSISSQVNPNLIIFVPIGDEMLSSLSCLQLTTIFSKASKLINPCPLGSASQIISNSSSSLAYFPNSSITQHIPNNTFLNQFLLSITLPNALQDSNFSKHLFFSFSLSRSSLTGRLKFLFFFFYLLIYYSKKEPTSHSYYGCWLMLVLTCGLLLLSMFSSFKKGLRSIDFYQAVPSDYSQGTVSGACISVSSIALLFFLCVMSVLNFSAPKIDSDLIIDQKHLAEKLKVYIDIQFPRYPCSFLSLDVENILKVHLVNVQDNLKKIALPERQEYKDDRMSDQEKLAKVIEDINAKRGCRMTGFFEIDRVPGNFHFSCHGYGPIIHQLINQGYRMLDMSHHIYQLRFGDQKSEEYGTNSLGGFNSEKEIEQVFMGITYTYFLDIIEKNSIDVNQQKGKESYIYTARLNEVILAQLPMVYFRYETNPMTVLQIQSHNEWHTLFIDIVGILGGIFTVASIIDHMVHSSIRFLVEKNNLGKLR